MLNRKTIALRQILLLMALGIALAALPGTAAHAMGGGGGGGGGSGGGGAGGGDTGGGDGGPGGGEGHGAGGMDGGMGPGGQMRDQDMALQARRSGQAEALEKTVQRLERKHGGKVLDVKIVRERGRMAYRIRLLDARNRLIEVDVPLRPVRRTNFGPRNR